MTWPEPGYWGAMPSAEYIDNPYPGLDSYHLHRWLDKKNPEDEYEQWFALFAEKEEVDALAAYLNHLEHE